eukprot:931138-Rhodomonas_salina.1
MVHIPRDTDREAAAITWPARGGCNMARAVQECDQALKEVRAQNLGKDELKKRVKAAFLDADAGLSEVPSPYSKGPNPNRGVPRLKKEGVFLDADAGLSEVPSPYSKGPNPNREVPRLKKEGVFLDADAGLSKVPGPCSKARYLDHKANSLIQIGRDLDYIAMDLIQIGRCLPRCRRRPQRGT